MATKLNKVAAIKRYFEGEPTSPNADAQATGRKIELMGDMKSLTTADRVELAQMAIGRLGPEFELEA